MSDSEELTPEQLRLLSALMVERSVGDAAKKADVPESTARRWRRLPAFKKAFRVACREVIEHTIARIQMSACEAVDALQRGLHSGVPEVEVRSAKIVLDQSMKGVDFLDTFPILEEVEELVAALSAPASVDSISDPEDPSQTESSGAFLECHGVSFDYLG